MENHSKSHNNVDSPSQLLDTAYRELDYISGDLLSSTTAASLFTDESIGWLEKGDWLTLAAKINADKIFFVNNEPVIVFNQVFENSPDNLLKVFRRVWCLARPQLLFIACPGELKIFSLNQNPPQNLQDWKKIVPLDIIKSTVEVSEKLNAYRRERVESGELFSDTDKNFGRFSLRADKRLITDLKIIRQSLLNINRDINTRFIHALIGRSIFIRYLEDCGILTPEYFEKVATDNAQKNWSPEWGSLLNETEIPDLSPDSEHRRFTRVLRDKNFTYALFHQLAEHFNGDMFPQSPEEERALTQTHLNLLRKFLLGDTESEQLPLFLWAYNFEIIPIELISNIYEEFYHQTDNADNQTHYTPGFLVEYMLSELLTPQRLAKKPKILDFACGSAIFLVHAFQRLVRFRESQLNRPLNSGELRTILREQITGIEINAEAIHVAAFSLYIALLHYQEPKSILAQIEQTNNEKPLPPLIFDASQKNSPLYYQILFPANAFDLMQTDADYLNHKLAEKTKFKGRIEYKRLLEKENTLPLEPNSFDIIVSNPPWGYLKKGAGTPQMHKEQEHVLRWCQVFGWPIGDNELSQAFVARSLDFLKPDGACGLLISAGVLLKRHENSVKFRQRWLSESCIKKVVNFSHVREIIFSNAIAPFCLVHFENEQNAASLYLEYWSAKNTQIIENRPAVVLNLNDLHRVQQRDLLLNDYLWKVYWWGSHRDSGFLSFLLMDESLIDIVRKNNGIAGQGYKAGMDYESDWLKEYEELPINLFKRYGRIRQSSLKKIPDYVHRRGIREVYSGYRILVKRGITQEKDANGRIEARLENISYCFRNSVHAIRLDSIDDWKRKILIGTLWSSFARYFYFMTTSSWGTWHHEIHLKDGLLSLPVRFPEDEKLRARIVEIVDELMNWNPEALSLLNADGLSPKEIQNKQNDLEKALDAAIFDLFDLDESERDLILDTCETGLEFFYRKSKSRAVKPIYDFPRLQGITADLPGNRGAERGLEGYLYAFLQIWNQELQRLKGEFRWRIVREPRANMLAVIFSTQFIKNSTIENLSQDEPEWNEVLFKLEKNLQYPVSQRIYIDGMIRAVTETDIIIIKKNERRLWTRSLAREDAEATLVQAMALQKAKRN